MSHKIEWVEDGSGGRSPILHMKDHFGNYVGSQSISREQAYRIAAGMESPSIQREPLTKEEIRRGMESLKIEQAIRQEKNERLNAWREEQFSPDYETIFSGMDFSNSPSPLFFEERSSENDVESFGIREKSLYFFLYLLCFIIGGAFFIRLIF